MLLAGGPRLLDLLCFIYWPGEDTPVYVLGEGVIRFIYLLTNFLAEALGIEPRTCAC